MSTRTPPSEITNQVISPGNSLNLELRNSTICIQFWPPQTPNPHNISSLYPHATSIPIPNPHITFQPTSPSSPVLPPNLKRPFPTASSLNKKIKIGTSGSQLFTHVLTLESQDGYALDSPQTCSSPQTLLLSSSPHSLNSPLTNHRFFIHIKHAARAVGNALLPPHLPSCDAENSSLAWVAFIVIAIIWNCCGLGQATTVRSLREYIHSHRLGLVFLSEVKISDANRTQKIARSLGFKNSHLVPSRGLSGGLLLFWKNSYQIQVIVDFIYFINCLVTEAHFESLAIWQLSLIYGPPTPSVKPVFWEDLTKMGQVFDGPWMIASDFNTILGQRDKLGGSL